MRILYGVVGEGMGHAIRSRVVLDHLFKEGHQVEIMASGRAVEFLRKRYGEVHSIHGLHIIYEENRVRKGKTLWSNALSGAAGVPKNLAAYFRLIDDFAPEVVISDFESWTYFYGKAHRVPVISIDNMQILNRCTLPEEVVSEDRRLFGLTKAFVKSKLPFCDHYFIATFFRPPLRKKNTTLVPPLLRPEVLEAERVAGDHLLIYQTAEGYGALIESLERSGVECRIYGMRRSITEEQVEGSRGNLRYRPFSEETFITDLASARGVIAGGGFTLMGEAVYLRKPMLSVPVGGQFEQILNARYLQHLGYGRYARDLEDPALIEDWIEHLPEYQEALSGYSQEGNTEALAALDLCLDRAAAGIL